MMNEKPKYLFFSSSPLFKQHDISTISIKEEKPCEVNENIDDADSELLPHSDMSWGSIEDRYVPFEIISDDDLISISSSCSTSSSAPSLVLDEMPVIINEDALKCVHESNWSSYALDTNSWDDDRAPVVRLRYLKDALFDELEFCGFFTDRLIGIGSSFLEKSPENGLYVLHKCIMRDMSLSNITMLHYHRYLRYIDLAYNYITSLLPLGGISYLMYLNVAHNRLTTILNFNPPWYLTYVNLSYNYISEMCDISSFWSIIHLDLSHNAIEVISGLQSLKYLKYLNLSYNLIECIENLDKLNIQELNLEGNCISSFKSSTPGFGINTLPHLRKIYLGYNRLTTLELFKDAYSLRVVDLKFNRINDLLEVSNFKGLIDEIDLTGNGCTKWPNYKWILLFSLPSIQIVDGAYVSSSEKIHATTLFATPANLTAARTVTKLTLLEQLSTPKIDVHVKPYDELSPPLITLTGPSAVKKISLALRIIETFSKRVIHCKWHTTREPTGNEIENLCYIFTDREKFNDMSRHGEFLAIQDLLGNSYGFHHSQIASLILENKIGIIQMDLHATMQISKRYPNVKPVLVLTKSEQVHRNWIQEKFDIYACPTQNADLLNKETNKNAEKITSDYTGNEVNAIKEILNDIIDRIQSASNDVHALKQNKDGQFHSVLKNQTSSNIKFQEKKLIKFQEEDKSNIEPNKDKGLRVILDEYSNLIIEDKDAKRKRHQAMLLQRRESILHKTEHVTDLSESVSSEEIFTEQIPLEMEKPEDLKDMYTELVIKTRTMYLLHHENNPGFFSRVLLTDDYYKALNMLIDFIFYVYTNQSNRKPKFLSEVHHLSQVAIPEMVNIITNEIKQSLSTSILQRKKLLRAYGVTSWKDIMPSQMVEDSID